MSAQTEDAGCSHYKLYVTDSTMRTEPLPCPFCERDRLRALNAELLAAVERAAGECGVCSGTGRYECTERNPATTLEPERTQCPRCADLRALIARAKGE